MPRAFLITNRRYFHVHGGGRDVKENTEKYDCLHESSINNYIKTPEISSETPEIHVLTAKVQDIKPENPSSPERDVYTAEGLESCVILKPSSPQSSASLGFTEWPQQIITVQNNYVPILSQYLGIGIDMRIPETYSNSDIRNAENHVCPECGKRYSTSSNLARHRQTHRSVTDKKARKCPHCDKVYVSTPAYSMHVRTHSQGCQCPYCGKAFSRPWLLQGHIRTHTGEKPFKCHICNKAFADKSNLRAHIQTHSTSKPYVCQRCGKAFALKSYLYKHEESSCMRINRINRYSDLNLK